MEIASVTVEEVDSVLTVTFAEDADESGFVFHVMRAVPGDEEGFDAELETYELMTRNGLCDGGVESWDVRGSSVELDLTPAAAEQLGVSERQVFDLAVPQDDVDAVERALRTALSPVGFQQV